MKKWPGRIRWVLLGLILGGSMLISYLHVHGGSQYPSVHAICPLGGLENLWAWLAGRGNLQKLFSGTMTLFFFTVIIALLFGRAFCGNICPFGALQELMGKITKRKARVPARLDKYLRYLKYGMLALVTIMAWITAKLWISPYDPYTAFAHIWSGEELFAENAIGFVILVIVLAASVFIDRFFCKYLCPAGALYGACSKTGLMKIHREACIGCSACSKVCPMNIDVASQETIRSAECIACGQCVAACPTDKLSFRFSGWTRGVKPLVYTITTVALFFGSIAIFNSVGLYQVTVPTLAQVEQNGDYIQIRDLRGSMTIEQGIGLTGLTREVFYQELEIPAEIPPETKLKDLDALVPGYDFHVVKAK